MPYIKHTRRAKIDHIIQEFVRADIQADGDLNYILYSFCNNHVRPGYNNYKNFCAELRQCATEIERRILARYEDEMIKQNGDIK